MRTLFNFILFILVLKSIFSCSKLDRQNLVGIDISHHQGKINWNLVSSENFNFAFIKATEGVSFRDKRYYINYRNAKKIGLKTGSYHFFRANLSPKKQARHFIKTIRLQSGDLLPVIDIESLDGVRRSVLIERVDIFLKEIEKEFGVKPIIYSSCNFYNLYLRSSFKDYPIWIAKYGLTEPILLDFNKYEFWQYSEKGKVKGINGYTDMNLFYGGSNDLLKFSYLP